METIDVQNVPPPPAPEAPQKRKVGRARVDPDIIRTDQPDYHRKHYHETRNILVECSVCFRIVTKNNRSVHKN